ncbi:cyclic nucleotide-binding protein, partial [Vibrio parahaemolyticus]
MDSTLLPNVVSFFKTIEPFHLLPDHVLDAIATNTDIVYWGKGESVSLVMPEGKNLYIIRAGVIEQRFPNGELRARLGENDVFGFNLEQDKYKVKTIENCLIYKINYAFLLKEVSNFENVVNQVAIRASQRLTSSINAQYSQVEKSLFFKRAKDLANHNVV